MAEAKKKRPSAKRKVRASVRNNPETVREKAAKQSAKAGSGPKRRIRGSARKASGPLKAVGRTIAKIARPFGFLLIPFRNRPVRFVGRVLSKTLLIGYIANSWRELRQVEWPDRRNTFKLTVAVFAFAALVSGLVAGVDYGLDKVFKAILLD